MTIDSSTRDKVIELRKKGKTRDDIVHTLSQSGIKISTGACSNIFKYERSLKSKSSQPESFSPNPEEGLSEIKFKKSIDNLKITKTQDFEKNRYDHIKYELGQKGAPLNWFTNNFDYQSVAPLQQQEDELAEGMAIGVRNLEQSSEKKLVEYNLPRKVYPRNPIEDKFFELDRKAWEYYGHAQTRILEQIKAGKGQTPP